MQLLQQNFLISPELYIQIGWQKLNQEGACPLAGNIIVNNGCTRKMLKVTEETTGFFVTFLSMVAFQSREPGP